MRFLFFSLLILVTGTANAGFPPNSSTNTAITALPGQKIQCNTASASQFGCLAAADFSTFSSNAPLSNPSFTGTVTIGSSPSTAVHQINGGVKYTTRTITTNLVIDTTTTDYIIFCNQSGAINVTFPAPANGRVLVIKDISGTANTNNITMLQHGSEKIEGLAASKILQTSWGSWAFASDGTDWYMVAM